MQCMGTDRSLHRPSPHPCGSSSRISLYFFHGRKTSVLQVGGWARTDGAGLDVHGALQVWAFRYPGSVLDALEPTPGLPG